MRATGIVRRIDELGRVVIPKELRRTMKIREGEELEVYTTENDELVLKKYSAVKELSGFAGEYAASIYATTGYTAIISDIDKIVAVSGDIKAYRAGNEITSKLEKLLEDRRARMMNGEEIFSLFGEEVGKIGGAAVAPIMNAGDVMGAIIIVSHKEVGELALKLVETAANFISTQL